MQKNQTDSNLLHTFFHVVRCHGNDKVLLYTVGARQYEPLIYAVARTIARGAVKENDSPPKFEHSARIHKNLG